MRIQQKLRYPVLDDSEGFINRQLADSGTVVNIAIFLGQQQPPVGQSLLIHVVSRSHTTTHHTR